MKKETVQKIILAVLVFGGLAYSYIVYLLTPELSVIQKQSSELTARQTYYQRLLNYEKDQPSLQNQIKELERQSAELNTKLPLMLDKPSLIVYLYSQAKASQLAPQSVSFEQQDNKTTYRTLAIQFSCTGKVTDILAFVNKIQSEGNQRLTVQSLTLTAQADNMKGDFKLISYASNAGNIGELVKPPVMNSGVGIDSVPKMFQK